MEIKGTDQLQSGILERMTRLQKDAGTEPGNFQKVLDDEMKGLFPGLYSGKISSGQVREKSKIQDEIAQDPERKRLYESAREFQAIFLNLMLKSMRSTLHKKDDLLYGGNRQEIFEDMLYNEYAKSLSGSPGFDMADQIYQDLSRKLPPVPENGAKATSEYERNMRKLDGEVSTGKRKNSWEWSY